MYEYKYDSPMQYVCICGREKRACRMAARSPGWHVSFRFVCFIFFKGLPA